MSRGDAVHHQRAAGPPQRVPAGRLVPRGEGHAEQPGEFGQRPAPGAGWTQIRKHGQRLPLITVR